MCLKESHKFEKECQEMNEINEKKLALYEEIAFYNWNDCKKS